PSGKGGRSDQGPLDPCVVDLRQEPGEAHLPWHCEPTIDLRDHLLEVSREVVERGVDVARVAIDASLRGVLRHREAQRREGGTNGAGDVLDDEPPFRPLTTNRVPHVASLPPVSCPRCGRSI